MRRAWVVTALVGVLALGVTTGGTVAIWRPAPFSAWPDSTFGAIVVDRGTRAVRVEYQPHRQFRSASLVKLLIALDALEGSGPVGAPDRRVLASMLRASDDDAAGLLWARDGYATIVTRTAARLGLVDTEPPPTSSGWGYTATSAADMARVYEYVLDEAPPDVRTFVLDHLRGTTRCAVDGRDQHFGIPRATRGPWASKQGWSGFGEVSEGTGCTPAPPSAVEPGADDRLAARLPPASRRTGSDVDVDLTGPLVHTSGVVGPGDATIVVVLSLHPDDTTYDEAAARLDYVTRYLVAQTA